MYEVFQKVVDDFILEALGDDSEYGDVRILQLEAILVGSDLYPRQKAKGCPNSGP